MMIKSEFGLHTEPLLHWHKKKYLLLVRYVHNCSYIAFLKNETASTVNLSALQMFPSSISQESPQELGLTKDRYLSERLATSLHTEQCMAKLRFVHKISVECPSANDSATLES